MTRFIRWIRNTRRATQRLGFCKPSAALTTTSLTRGEAKATLRAVVEHPLVLPAETSLVAWLDGFRDPLYHSVQGGIEVQAQAFYLFKGRSRTGWLSPKGAEEYVEVLPRQLQLVDEVFRPTELGEGFDRLLVSDEERIAWTSPREDVNPLELTSEQRYLLAYSILDSDGDFLVPWLGRIYETCGTNPFSLMVAGSLAPEVLREMAETFGRIAYLDEQRARVRGAEDAADGIEREVSAKQAGGDANTARGQNRLRHLAVPRLEWLVDLDLATKPDRDGTEYEFTLLGTRVIKGLLKEYRDIRRETFADAQIQLILDTAFAKMAAPILWGMDVVPVDVREDGVVGYLRPAYEALNAVSGYSLLRPLCVLAAIFAHRLHVSHVLEYSEAVSALDATYKIRPDTVHFTVDRLSTDIQVKLLSAPAPISPGDTTGRSR